MGMTDEQKVELARIKEKIDDRLTLAVVERETLVGWVEDLERENANWKQQCDRFVYLIDRIKKDMARELLAYKLKTS